MSILSPRRWRLRHLVLSWAAYWLSLAVVTLSSAGGAIWAASRAPKDNASISAGFENSVLSLLVKVRDDVVWSGTTTMTALALWVAGPPLLIWLVWLVGTRTQAPVAEAAPQQIGEAPPEFYSRRDDREARHEPHREPQHEPRHDRARQDAPVHHPTPQ